jgi:hypothetical protein
MTSNKPILITSLFGGLGNQMFQYAAGASLAARWNRQLFVDDSWYRRTFNESVMTRREFLLDQFPQLSNIDRKYPMAMPKLLRRIKSGISGEQWFEDSHGFMKFEESNKHKICRLHGYWQDPRYFIDQRELIRDAFTLNFIEMRNSNSLLPEISEYSSLGIHVRRGDYVTLPDRAGQPRPLSLNYYNQAIELATLHRQIESIYIVSDDPAWCAEHFTGDRFHIVENKNSTMEDFAILQTCEHIVMSNSTYSWWASWSGRSENQLAIFPKDWTLARSSSAYFPPTWVGI